MSKYKKNQWQNDDGSDSEPEDVSLFNNFWESYKYSTAVVIDNTKGMFEAYDEDENCHFKMALLACLKVLQKDLFGSYKRTFAVDMLSRDEYKPFISLNDNILESIQKLLDLTKQTNEELKEQFCVDKLDKNQFYNKLMDMGSMFSRVPSSCVKKSKKSISIVTNDPKPVSEDQFDEIQTLADGLNVSILVFPTISDFSYDVFYKNLVNASLQDGFITEFDDEGHTNAQDLSEALSTVAQSRDYVRRHCFYFGDGYNNNFNEIKEEGTFFHVEVHKFIKHKKLYRNVQVDPKNMRPVVACETGDNLSQEELELSETFENTEPVEYPRELSDLHKDKEFVDAFKCNPRPYGFKLLYLSQPRSLMHYMVKPQFILMQDTLSSDETAQSDDQSTPKRKEMFTYFWDHCYREQKVMICTFMHGKKHKHHLVELKPESYNGVPCFMGTHLAYQGQVQGHKEMPCLKIAQLPSERGVDISPAEEIVRKMTVKNPRKPFTIVNEQLERKANELKGLLFNTEWPEEEHEPYFPEREDIAKRLGPDLKGQFERNFCGAYVPRPKAPKRKRAAAKNDDDYD